MSLEVRPAPMSTKGLNENPWRKAQGFAYVLAALHAVARSGSCTNEVEAIHLTPEHQLRASSTGTIPPNRLRPLQDYPEGFITKGRFGSSGLESSNSRWHRMRCSSHKVRRVGKLAKRLVGRCDRLISCAQQVNVLDCSMVKKLKVPDLSAPCL